MTRIRLRDCTRECDTCEGRGEFDDRDDGGRRDTDCPDCNGYGTVECPGDLGRCDCIARCDECASSNVEVCLMPGEPRHDRTVICQECFSVNDGRITPREAWYVGRGRLRLRTLRGPELKETAARLVRLKR